MKLLYITTARIPTEKAHGVQIIKMCEAFQRQGWQVELMVPFRKQPPAMKKTDDVWKHYDVETKFSIKHLPTLDTIRIARKFPEKISIGLYYIQCFIFAAIALLVTIFQRNSIYYSRNLQVLFLLCLTKGIHRKKIYLEAHELHGEGEKEGLFSKISHRIMRWILRNIDGLIVITHRLKTLYASMGVSEEHILVAPDGIDKKRLSICLDKFDVRGKLQIPLDKKIVCYTGHLFQWKGVYTLAESSKYLPEDYSIYIVGGVASDVQALQVFCTEHQLKTVVVTGYVPYCEVPAYLAAADLLVLPNTARTKIAREYTSPLKLFEYMGARRPIVASNLPSLREVLEHKKNTYFVPPDDPKALADGIISVMQNKQLAKYLVDIAYKQIQEYTWDKRAKNILEFLNCNDVC